MKIKGFLAGAAAVLFAATATVGANLTLLSGPQDPSQMLATINTLIQNINFGVSGRLSASLTTTGTTTTAEQTLMTYTLPASRLANDGDAVRVVCWGHAAANGNVKTAKLYFGASTISTAASGPAGASNPSPSNVKWTMSLIVMRSGSATQVVQGTGMIGVSPISVYTNAGTDALTAAVTIKCTGTTPTTQGDISAQGMLVEQIK